MGLRFAEGLSRVGESPDAVSSMIVDTIMEGRVIEAGQRAADATAAGE
jgi:hypothetical protein